MTAGATYRITVNNFLADGGDGFTQLRQGTGRVTTSVDLDAFVAYLQANPTVKIQPQPGDFYGGWITSRVVGPFKGAPGTMFW